MTDLAAFAQLVPQDNGLCVLTTARADGTMQSTVVSGGVMRHPVTGADVVARVAAGGTQKLRNLAARPQATIVVRAGFRWATAEGDAEIIGPDHPHPAFAADALPQLLRDIFVAAGGTHDDWDTYDRVMAEERRAAVLITPRRVYSTPTS
jgi:PPOX class probable F420-dependent enzyme